MNLNHFIKQDNQCIYCVDQCITIHQINRQENILNIQKNSYLWFVMNIQLLNMSHRQYIDNHNFCITLCFLQHLHRMFNINRNRMDLYSYSYQYQNDKHMFSIVSRKIILLNQYYIFPSQFFVLSRTMAYNQNPMNLVDIPNR